MTGVNTKPWVEPVDGVIELTSADNGPAKVGYRRVRAGDLADSYPAGTHDIELLIIGHPVVDSLAETTQSILASQPRCRRVVLPVAEQDLASIAWAESAGFRYVVDVETREGAFSLLVTEPDWVIEQPQVLEDIPLDR